MWFSTLRGVLHDNEVVSANWLSAS
jgi:hypothetical protein